MTSEAATRIHCVVARDVRTAVVFRRGPTKKVRMLLWDLARDVITGGQWLAGRIYDSRCDISPDGKLVVYFAGKFKTKIATFTAVSRPPYFTALALWPDGSTWGGGGFFEENRTLVLNYARMIDELDGVSRVPADFTVTHLRDYGVRHPDAKTTEHGWTLVDRGSDAAPTATMRVVFSPPWISAKPNPRRPQIVLERLWHGMFEVNGPHCIYGYRWFGIPDRRDARDLGRLDWADWDHDGSLLFADAGCLFRCSLSDLLSGRAPGLVADLRAQTFTNVRPPPEALLWP